MPPWACRVEERAGLDCWTLEEDERPLTFAAFMARLEDDAEFRAFFDAALGACRFRAFFLELPPLTRARMELPLELVLIDAPPLLRLRADADAFADEFHMEGSSIATFPNLGGDATLVVPCPIAPVASYAHLAAFVRTAPSTQRSALWAAVARAVRSRVSDAPLWVSTAGLGVSWLHVRLDARPKYYRHLPYKTAP